MLIDGKFSIHGKGHSLGTTRRIRRTHHAITPGWSANLTLGLLQVCPPSARWKCLELDRAEAEGPGVQTHFFSSAGQFVKRLLIDEDFVRSAVSTAKRWPSALTSYRGEVRSG